MTETTSQEINLQGSCLCGGVSYTATGNTDRFYYCYCKRCRKATGSSHASNLFMTGSLSWHQGETLIKSYKLPEAERFGNHFCETCGSRLPKAVPEMNFVMIPAGSLDVEPPIKPMARIFQNSKAEWCCGIDDIAAFDEYPG